jgi:hypothetical protein
MPCESGNGEQFWLLLCDKTYPYCGRNLHWSI